MKKIFLLFGFCALLSACTMSGRLDAVRDGFNNGEFCAAASKFANEKVCIDNVGAGSARPDDAVDSRGGLTPPLQRLNNLSLLIAADAMFQNDDFAISDKAYEEANRRISEMPRASLIGEGTRIIGGQMAVDYKPYFMDDLFVSYYQIWGALISGRISDARVIVNQSYRKQQELSREFAGLIRSRQKDNSGLSQKLRDEDAQWNAFRDVMNPALTYLAGLYFLNYAETKSDYETARVYLSRASGMTPNSEFVRLDLAAARAGAAPRNIAWVFVESGFAPKLVERRIDWPLMMPGGVRMISFAVSDAKAIPGHVHPDGFELLADVDAMFMTEFTEYKVNEALRALAAAASRLAVQSIAQNQLGLLGNLGAAIYSVATTTADVRSWVTLPKRIYILRVRKDGTGIVKVSTGNRVISEIVLPKTGNSLVYIRLLNNRVEPKVVKISN